MTTRNRVKLMKQLIEYRCFVSQHDVGLFYRWSKYLDAIGAAPTDTTTEAYRTYSNSSVFRELLYVTFFDSLSERIKKAGKYATFLCVGTQWVEVMITTYDFSISFSGDMFMSPVDKKILRSVTKKYYSDDLNALAAH